MTTAAVTYGDTKFDNDDIESIQHGKYQGVSRPAGSKRVRLEQFIYKMPKQKKTPLQQAVVISEEESAIVKAIEADGGKVVSVNSELIGQRRFKRRCAKMKAKQN